jgi:hypothetical protein
MAAAFIFSSLSCAPLLLLRWRMYKNATRVLILLEASYFRWLRVFSLRRHSTRAPESQRDVLQHTIRLTEYYALSSQRRKRTQLETNKLNQRAASPLM